MSDSGAMKKNQLMANVAISFKKYGKVVIHPCPYLGDHFVRNYTMYQQALILFPTGNYRIDVHAGNDLDDNIFSFLIALKTF